MGSAHAFWRPHLSYFQEASTFFLAFMFMFVAGRDIFGTGYEQVLGEMLTQGNSYAHVPARRIVWLQAAQPLLQVPFSQGP